MQTQLIIDDLKGNLYEIPHSQIRWKTQRVGRAGSLEFTYIGGDVFTVPLNIENGNVILLRRDGKNVFYGYVRSIASDDGVRKVVCYDQLFALKFKDIKAFFNKKASEVLAEIAKENGLKLGKVADTKYTIPKAIYNNSEELFTMVTTHILETTRATGRLYTLLDNCGSIDLLDIADTKLDLVIDGDSNLTRYSYTKDIESDTFNFIKLVKKDSKGGIEKIIVEQDPSTVGKWGRLQYTEVVDEKENIERVKEKARSLLKAKNKERKSFKLSNVIGDIRCRAGYSVFIDIPKEGIKNYYLIDKAEHKFTDNEHLMDLELVVMN